MPPTPFIVADLQIHRDELVELNIEYVSWVFAGLETLFHVRQEQIVGMPVSEYVSAALDKVCGEKPAGGVFYLLRVEGQLAGMGGLRALASGAGEIKRLYVRPAFRGQGLGDALLQRLLTDARTFGYLKVCLDSALFMTSAHRLYERHGFEDGGVYEGVEVPAAFQARWRYMQRLL